MEGFLNGKNKGGDDTSNDKQTQHRVFYKFLIINKNVIEEEIPNLRTFFYVPRMTSENTFFTIRELIDTSRPLINAIFKLENHD